MVANMQMKLSCAAVIGVIAILSFASISSAYSYSSSVSTSGNTITAQYLTINVFDGTYTETGDTASTEVVLTLDEATIDDKKMIKDCVTATPKKDYSVRVSSNGLEQAYVYGYFTCSSDVGVAVKYIEITFTDGSKAILVKDAYQCGLTATTAKVDTLASLSEKHDDVNYKDYQISTISIYYYEGLTTSGGNIVVGHGSGSGVTDSSSEEATSATALSAFQFHFLASRASLINSSA